MNEELDIVVTGVDVELHKAEAGLVRVFGIEPHNARRVLRELPMIARRGASLAIAERYVAALRSIGARVELRPAGFVGDSVRVDAPALPVPLPSAIAGLQESIAIEREADGAIARFRASEGLDSLRMDGDLNLINPAIPKAPAIPHDLARMPNAALPRFSDRPSFRAGGFSLKPDGALDSLGARPPHVDAQLPPAVSAMRFDREKPASSASNSPSVRPGAVGLAPHAAASSTSPRWSEAPRAAPVAPARRTWPLLAGLLAIALGFALFTLGTRQSGALQAASLSALGIETGESAPASTFFAATDHELDGMSHDLTRALIDKLERAGTPALHALQIHARDGHAIAGALAVELPSDPNARRTVFGLLAKARSTDTLEPDRGQRYSVLSFK